MASNTFENISVRTGYDKGQSTRGMKWFPKTKLTIEKGRMLYSSPTVRMIANNGTGFKQEFGNIVYWKDNACIRSKKKIMWGMPAAKPNRIDLVSRLGNTVASLSVPDENTYNNIKQTLISLIGAAKCEIAKTRAELQSEQHLTSLTARRSRFPGGRRRTRKHKKRKTKRIRKTKRRKRKRKRKTKRRKRGGEKAELNTCIKKCNDAEEERKKQKQMERKVREQEWMKKTYAMGYQSAIAAHGKRQQDRVNPITGRAAAMAALKKEAARKDRLFGGGKRRR